MRHARALAAPSLAVLVLGLSFDSLLAQVAVNEVLASNRRTSLDEDGDSSDWIELLNLGTETVRLAGYGLSDDATRPLKWVLPDVSIPPGGFLTVWCSGKDRFVDAQDAVASAGELAFRPLFVARGASWRYVVAAVGPGGPPAGWNVLGFDASALPEGTAGFGYGDGDDATVLPSGTTAVFIRRDFEVGDPGRIGNLVLQIDYDDGFIAYLNGVRVAERNAPAGDPDFTFQGTAKREAGTVERFDLTGAIGRLVPGTNVLAVVGLNTPNGDGSPSSDMSLHPELGIVPTILHTNFQLDSDAELVVLSAPDGEFLDGIAFGPQTADHSYGRQPDGVGSWFYLLTPTQEAPNATRGFSSPISASVEASIPPGRYAPAVEVELFAEPAGLVEIYYTVDGTEPTPASARYGGPLVIRDNTVLRIAGFIGPERATAPVSKSYFVGRSFSGGIVDLPVLSISMDPADFQTVHLTTDARGRASERAGYWEYFDARGSVVASTGFGLRLHGGAGRGGDLRTKKAYKAYFRGTYGDPKLRYRIMPDSPVEEFDKLVLRSGFNDSFRTNGRATYLRDEIIRDLHEDMGALASHGAWCQLYVNMEYRGVYNVVERMDEEFLEAYLGSEDWDVIKTGDDVLVGTRDEWDRLWRFVIDNDLSNETLYRQATELLDLENFTSYMILNIWAQNHDWPHNNWYAARRRDPEARWIFLSWDAEFGVGLIPSGWTADTFEFVFSRSGRLRDILDNLLASPVYRGYFLEQAERHTAGALAPANVLARIAALRQVVEPDIADEMALMGRTITDWRNNVRELENFARSRNAILMGYLTSSSRLAGAVDTAPDVDSVNPPSITGVPDAEVELVGRRLHQAIEVFFNGVPAEVVGSVFLSRLRVRVPFAPEVFGPVTLRLRDPETGGERTRDGLLEVLPPVPRVTEIDPPQGTFRGGDRVRIRGGDFLDGVMVLFGGVEAPLVERIGGGSEELDVVTPPGDGEVEVLVVNTVPSRLESASVLRFRYERPRFLRGDASGNGLVDISDAIRTLEYLFTGGTLGGCPAAADTDRNGALEITDALVLLSYLFLEGEPLAPPFPACGGMDAGEPLACDGAARCS